MTMKDDEPIKRFIRPDGTSVFDQDGRYVISDRTHAKNRERVDALFAYDVACAKALGIIQEAVRGVHSARSLLGDNPERMDAKMAFVMEESVDDVTRKFARQCRPQSSSPECRVRKIRDRVAVRHVGQGFSGRRMTSGSKRALII